LDSKQEAQTEAAGTWQGRVETLVVDNFQNGTSRQRLFLHTSKETLELQTAGDGALRPGQLVEVTGRASGGRLIVSQVKASDSAAATGTCTAIGEQKALIILASYPSKALLSSVTPALISSGFFGPGQTVDNFLQESSFGQTWLTGDVVGPFVLDADYNDQALSTRDAALRAAAPTTDLTKYSRIFVVAPQGQTGMDSGGMALLGCGQISSPQGNLFASSMWLGAESMVSQDAVVFTASHEIGHGFGLSHARFADYGNDPLGPTGQTAAPWDQIHDYGDFVSDMGRASGQWSAPHKAWLGWLQTGTNIQTVTTAGNFNLSPYEQTGGGQVLRVSRGTSDDAWLWLEFRQPLGAFDADLAPAAFTGALVHYEDPGLTATVNGADPTTYTNMVNFHTGVAYPNDPTLHAGETWTDPYGSLSLTIGSATAAGLNVTVSYAPAPVCASSAGGLQTFAAAGGKGSVPVAAPGTCSWSAGTSVPWITLGAPNSGTGNGSLSFTVAANIDVAPRWGRITVGDAFAIVIQAGASAWMTLSPQTAFVSAAGGTGQIAAATSAPDYSWDFSTFTPWITDVDSSTMYPGPATVSYIVAQNAGPERTGTITVGGLPFSITQRGGWADPNGIAWDQLAPQDAPQARELQAMAPFGHSGQAILYGGQYGATCYTDTWLWDGSEWTSLAPANNPGMIFDHAMAYDDARGQIVLFGGWTCGDKPTFSNQTWIWDGNNWTQKHPAVSPSERIGHAMAYDPVSQKVVLFGGGGPGNDTWTWDGTNWTKVASPVLPPGRQGHSMAFDAVRGEMVLFGGTRLPNTGIPVWLSDTWVWDGSTWHEKSMATPPAGRTGHVLAYHAGLGAVVMIGGTAARDISSTTYNQDLLRDTWMWTGDEWVQQFPENQPGPANSTVAAYDDTKQALTVQLGDDLTCLSRGPKTFVLQGHAAGSSGVMRPPQRLTR
jgi:M6 family metalloprotease-like protein